MKLDTCRSAITRICATAISISEPLLFNAVIGSNGSGKSNVIEAILHILMGVYFRKAPPFSFRFQFELNGAR